MTPKPNLEPEKVAQLTWRTGGSFILAESYLTGSFSMADDRRRSIMVMYHDKRGTLKLCKSTTYEYHPILNKSIRGNFRLRQILSVIHSYSEITASLPEGQVHVLRLAATCLEKVRVLAMSRCLFIWLAIRSKLIVCTYPFYK